MFKDNTKNLNHLIERFVRNVTARLLSEESEEEKIQRLEKRLKDRAERERQVDLDRQQLSTYNTRQAMLSRSPQVKSSYTHQKPELQRTKQDRDIRNTQLEYQKKEESNIINQLKKVLEETQSFINTRIVPNSPIDLLSRKSDVSFSTQGGKLTSTYRSDYTVEEKVSKFTLDVNNLLDTYALKADTVADEIENMKVEIKELGTQPKSKNRDEKTKKLNTVINRKYQDIKNILDKINLTHSQLSVLTDKMKELEVVRSSIKTLQRQIG